jgi:selT-like protein
VVTGENYQPSHAKSLLASFLNLGKFILIGLLASNVNPFSYFGLTTPSVWTWLNQHRIYGSLLIFFLSNTLENHLLSSGAFEISYNGRHFFDSFCHFVDPFCTFNNF